MRILHVTSFYEPAYSMGGLAVLTANLVRGQVREGASVSVFTTDAGLKEHSVNQEGEDRDGARVYYFATRSGSRLFFSWRLLRACWNQTQEFDIVHVHGMWNFPSTWAAMAAFRSRVPYVLSPQGSLNRWAMEYRPYKKRPYWWMLERRTVLRSRQIHFATQDEATQARVWIGKHPAAVIPVAVETPALADPVRAAAWRVSVGVPRGAPLIGFLGRIHPVKGLDLLLEAMAHVPGAHLLIAGPDEGDTRDRLIRKAATLGIAHRVRWPGLLDVTARGAMFAAIDLFVLPSHSENFGLAAAEAMAVGVPVVVTPGVNLAAAIAAGGAGCVVPRDPSSLGKILLTLLTDKPMRTAMGTAGRRLVEERFSPQVVARQMLGLYRECLTSPHSSVGSTA